MRGEPPPPRLLEAWGDPLGPSAVSRTGTALFVLLVAIAAFHDLAGRSLHNLDLPRFGVLAREMLRTGEWLVPQRYGEVYAAKPPLLIWLVALPSALTGGVTPLWVRLPSALGFFGLVLTVARWGRWRTGSWAAGRAAALLLAGTYACTRFGREGRPDMLASAFAVGAAALIDRAASGRGRAADPWLAGLLAGLALLTKGPVMLLVPVLVLLLPSEGRSFGERMRTGRGHLALGVALAVAALWFVPATLHGGTSYAGQILFEQAATRIAGTSTHVEGIGYYAVRLLDGGAPWTPLYLSVLVLLLWPAGRRALGPTASVAAAALLALALFSLVPTKHLRYLLPVFALLGLGAGWVVTRAIARWGARVGPRARRGAGCLLGGATLALYAVAVFRLPAAALPLAVPAVGLLAIGGALWRRAPLDGGRETASGRRLAGAALAAVVLLTSAYWVVRVRHRVRTREAFDRAVAAAVLPDVPVFTLAPLEPGHVFEGAPRARLAREVSDLPGRTEAPRLLVLAAAERRAAVEAARGAPARVLLEERAADRGPTVLLLSFEAR